MKRSRRGASAAAVVMAIAGLTAVVAIGFSMRDGELVFRDRSRCRAAARWAAESAVARGRARLARGIQAPLDGALDAATYRLRVERSAAGSVLVGTGACSMDKRTTRVELRVTVDTGGRVTDWVERAPD